MHSKKLHAFIFSLSICMACNTATPAYTAQPPAAMGQTKPPASTQRYYDIRNMNIIEFCGILSRRYHVKFLFEFDKYRSCTIESLHIDLKWNLKTLLHRVEDSTSIRFKKIIKDGFVVSSTDN